MPRGDRAPGARAGRVISLYLPISPCISARCASWWGTRTPRCRRTRTLSLTPTLALILTLTLTLTLTLALALALALALTLTPSLTVHQVRAVRRDTGEKEDVAVAVLVQKVSRLGLGLG